MLLLIIFQYGGNYMNALDFFTKYKNRVNVETVGMSVYQDNKAFTELINKNVIPEIIESQCDPKLTAQNEYFRIDTVGWVSRWDDVKVEAKRMGLNPHLWDLKVAVEHENSSSDWTDEVIKLIHVKCPMKVIIGYNNSDKRVEEELEKLEFVSKCMNMIEAFKNSKDEEYLIILGNYANSKTKKADYKDFDYKGYLYNWKTNSFEEIAG